MYSHKPTSVDQNPSFYPPPQETADGGQQGFFDSFPGVHSHGTPLAGGEPPRSAQSWTYVQHATTGTSPWPPPQQLPVWGPTTPPSPWSATNPASTWGAVSPTGSYAPMNPSGYPGFAGYGPQPHSPYNTPGTPNASSTGQPITPGWFGAEKKKRKKRHSIGEHSSWDDGMRRSNSLGLSIPPRVPLQRSASWGHLHSGRKSYNIFNLARRPRDWRPDYTPREGIAALAAHLPTIGRSKSDVREFSDPVRRTLHPLLLWNPQSPPIYFDLRNHSYKPNTDIHFLNLPRPHNHIDLAQLVCQPSTSFLRLSHPRLPWYIDVVQTHPNGITIGDIFGQIHLQVHIPIQENHFFNEELNEVDQSRLTRAFEARVGKDPKLLAAGILRVDFLGDKYLLEGFVKGSRGIWEMKMMRG